LARGVSKVTVIELEERHADFPGVYSMINYRREYLSPIPVCHILGYIGAMNANEYDLYRNLGYGVSDLIGKSGVEKIAEKDLHGRSGRMVVETDPMGRIQRVVRVDRPEPGDNIILTIDLGLQTVASESLAKTINDISSKAEGKTSPQNKGDANSGAVVVMDINSGEVLALASYPFYDPSLFLEPSTNAETQRSITELFTDALSPSLNRAISGQYPPGSTFKPLIAIAALEEGIIAPNQYIEDPGMIYVDRTPLLCLETRHGALPHGHGFIELSTALATSCNIYFHKLGLELTGDGIDKWGRIFGLGERTGIDLDSESKGIRASPEYKRTKKDAGSWGQLDTALAAIGQHDNSFTPIQLCNYMAVIASNGRKYTPHVILRRESFDGMKVYNTLANYEQLSVSQSIFEEVKEGMLKVANSQEGTAATVFAEFTEKYGIVVAGKTGTAETSESMSTAEDHSNNGVFICYAPAENPQIAVAVVIQRGVFGYYAADVAKDIMEYYFGEMTTIHPGDKGSEASRPLGYAYLIE
ncbi:MAG: penicillin-binding transpeptidase domain-containing protein, partial [Oscillospiraceae bacterium]|nr:penicillin-binding transpeptidase domain-containing protein [Oscillospiraceae bacterium]